VKTYIWMDVAVDVRFVPKKGDAPAAILAAEDGYHADMARSLFSVTYRKGGWDCLRHLEIIAAGALPVFTDIDDLPSGDLSAYPKRVFQLLKQWPGLDVRGLPGTPVGPGERVFQGSAL
jgi:hypothetical protein